ncbi:MULTISPECIES: hypothetical protein [Prochlorococcus]|nr:hypothetical protein [Prochlorococcus marinus]
MEIKIFDTIIHSGMCLKWPSKPSININILKILELIDNETMLKGALVQTSPWFDSSNSIELFYKSIISHKTKKRIIPVATIPNLSLNKIKSFIDDAIEIGYKVFKIHPRFSEHGEKEIEKILDYLLPKANLVQICTYQSQNVKTLGNSLEASKFLELLAYKSNFYSTHIMLMHAFDISILQAHSIVRHNKYLILDLSMTILKYDGSSIDHDISYLFKHFDRRICIGSDYPEWSYRQLEKKLLTLIRSVPEDKLRNIFYGNVEKILNL